VEASAKMKDWEYIQPGSLSCFAIIHAKEKPPDAGHQRAMMVVS
jgi:hypothetical protein